MDRDFNENKMYVYFFTSIGLLFFILGIILFIFEQYNYTYLKNHGIRTDGIISNIKFSNNKKNVNVFVGFKTDDGEEITTKIGYYNSNMYIGQSVELYYDPMNYKKVVMIFENFNYNFLWLFMSGMGLIFFIMGFVKINENKAFERQRDKLILLGYYVMADIIEIKREANIQIKINLNKKNPYRIHAYYSENDIGYSFISHYIWFEPSYFKKKVRVYLDRNNYAIYYVDADSLN